MAGHNKWSKVKHTKGPADAKRGRIFSRLAREISIAAREGGGDPAMNARLRSAIQSARDQNMPNDTIERAVKKGTGELGGEAIEEIVYEGYGPGGVAVLVEAATDNKNRTAAEMRMIFTKNHGNLGTSGSVGYLFQRKGQILVAASAAEEDRLFELAVDAEAEEMAGDGEHYVITTPFDRFYGVAAALEGAGIPIEDRRLVYLAENSVPVADPQVARQVMRLCEALEDSDDVQAVHANFEIPEELMAEATA